MNLKLKSCKSDAQSMTVVVVDLDTGREVSSFITARTCGGPFLAHDASVKQLLEDLLAALSMPVVVPVEEVTEPAIVPLRPSKAPKGAA